MTWHTEQMRFFIYSLTLIIAGQSCGFAQNATHQEQLRIIEDMKRQEDIERNQRNAYIARRKAEEANAKADAAIAELNAIKKKEQEKQLAIEREARRKELARQQAERLRIFNERKAMYAERREAARVRVAEHQKPPRASSASVIQKALPDGRIKVMAGSQSGTFNNQAEADAWLKIQQQNQTPASSTLSSSSSTEGAILEVIGASFAKQVLGTFEKGGRCYLQLQGGGLLKSDTSFPAKIPEFEGQTFTVTLSDITPRGYTLEMGAYSLPVLFNPSGKTITSARP